MRVSTLNLPRFGAGIGLARTALIAQRLGLDLAALGRRSVVIAGSNGKGSVARMLASLFAGAGERTGLFTSPHLHAFNERFEIAGTPIDDAVLERLEARVASAIADHLVACPGDQPAAFEAGFLTALLWFEEAGADRLVIEAGIGGRYDPTRLLRAPHVALVSLDAEHMPLLGTTLREVALDKLDVAPPGARVVLGRSLAGERAAIETVAGLKDVVVTWVADVWLAPRSSDSLSGHAVRLTHGERGRLDMTMAMHGRFQADNLEVALDVFAGARPDLFAAGWPSLIASALAGCRNPARMECFDRGPGLILDAGHTPAGIGAAVESVQTLLDGRPATLLLGMSADKPVAAMLDVVAPAFDTVIVSAAAGGVPTAELAAAYLQRQPAARVRQAADADAALALACEDGDDRILVALGGLFWAAAVREAWLATTATTCAE
ncbi:bifunctional folylpolyglutamate synthase/dihydrofolate synthase [Maricaulis maris]|uniref:Dihydrofolate synthase/folylpolyglutamate synthase n=1 Tax=Maricaulis maris TaxID=74318 RepID=A0A495D3T6_9PROT|nr:cyanophycin synthetase [Maricaulis maris]RKQ95630.1 dihydrofolate synthase/folylpolyglutamate synthase [Maricaulis maris]